MHQKEGHFHLIFFSRSRGICGKATICIYITTLASTEKSSCGVLKFWLVVTFMKRVHIVEQDDLETCYGERQGTVQSSTAGMPAAVEFYDIPLFVLCFDFFKPMEKMCSGLFHGYCFLNQNL